MIFSNQHFQIRLLSHCQDSKLSFNYHTSCKLQVVEKTPLDPDWHLIRLKLYSQQIGLQIIGSSKAFHKLVFRLINDLTKNQLEIFHFQKMWEKNPPEIVFCGIWYWFYFHLCLHSIMYSVFCLCSISFLSSRLSTVCLHCLNKKPQLTAVVKSR